jgi:hypothetical protein
MGSNISLHLLVFVICTEKMNFILTLKVEEIFQWQCEDNIKVHKKQKHMLIHFLTFAIWN